MLFAWQLRTIDIIRYWSLGFVPLAVVLFVLPCRMRVRHQARWIMFLLLCGIKGIVYEQFGGDAMAPDLPEGLIWFWNWLDDGLFFLVLLSLVWWVRRGRAWILPAVAWGVALWGQLCGTVVPPVHEVELEFPNLPAELDGYRIVQVSDLHCSSAARRWRTQAVVDRVNGLDADLVCLTGDYVDGLVRNLAADLAPLTALKAKDGVCCVRGNHEYYADKYAWRDWYEENGLRMLVNECVFPRKGLAVGGVNDDISAKRFGDEAADVDKTFAAATNGEFRILLEHRPIYAYTNLVVHKVDLQLSGHTHGGVAPLVDRVVASRNCGYVRGIYRIDGRVLYVSPGCGQWVGFPMRFFIPSEIALITLRKEIHHDDKAGDAAGGADCRSGVGQLPFDSFATHDHCHPNDSGAPFMGKVYAAAVGRILGSTAK